jgi:hypothetical protein
MVASDLSGTVWLYVHLYKGRCILLSPARILPVTVPVNVEDEAERCLFIFL